MLHHSRFGDDRGVHRAPTPHRCCFPFPFGSRWLLALLLLATTASATAQNLDFSLPDPENKPVRLSDFRGRWVTVNFWATWCSPCLLEMPELQTFHETHRASATVIGINFQSLAAAEIRDFAKRLSVTFPIALSGGNPIPGFKLKVLPTTFLISPAGELIYTYEGTVNAAMLAERLAEIEKTGRPAR